MATKTWKAGTNANTCAAVTVASCGKSYGFTAGTVSADAKCNLCGSGTYSSTIDATACKSHTNSNCGSGLGFQDGTTSANSACVGCTSGKWSGATANKDACAAHTNSNCGKGQGFVNGTTTANSDCVPCTSVQWSGANDKKACAVNATALYQMYYEHEDVKTTIVLVALVALVAFVCPALFYTRRRIRGQKVALLLTRARLVQCIVSINGTIQPFYCPSTPTVADLLQIIGELAQLQPGTFALYRGGEYFDKCTDKLVRVPEHGMFRVMVFGVGGTKEGKRQRVDHCTRCEGCAQAFTAESSMHCCRDCTRMLCTRCAGGDLVDHNDFSCCDGGGGKDYGDECKGGDQHPIDMLRQFKHRIAAAAGKFGVEPHTVDLWFANAVKRTGRDFFGTITNDICCQFSPDGAGKKWADAKRPALKGTCQELPQVLITLILSWVRMDSGKIDPLVSDVNGQTFLTGRVVDDFARDCLDNAYADHNDVAVFDAPNYNDGKTAPHKRGGPPMPSLDVTKESFDSINKGIVNGTVDGTVGIVGLCSAGQSESFVKYVKDTDGAALTTVTTLYEGAFDTIAATGPGKRFMSLLTIENQMTLVVHAYSPCHGHLATNGGGANAAVDANVRSNWLSVANLHRTFSGKTFVAACDSALMQNYADSRNEYDDGYSGRGGFHKLAWDTKQAAEMRASGVSASDIEKQCPDAMTGRFFCVDDARWVVLMFIDGSWAGGRTLVLAPDVDAGDLDEDLNDVSYVVEEAEVAGLQAALRCIRSAAGDDEEDDGELEEGIVRSPVTDMAFHSAVLMVGAARHAFWCAKKRLTTKTTGYGGANESQEQRDHSFGGAKVSQEQRDHLFGGAKESREQKAGRNKGRHVHGTARKEYSNRGDEYDLHSEQRAHKKKLRGHVACCSEIGTTCQFSCSEANKGARENKGFPRHFASNDSCLHKWKYVIEHPTAASSLAKVRYLPSGEDITRHTLALKYKKYMFSNPPTKSPSGSKDKSKLEFDKPSYDSWWENLSQQQKGK